MASDEIRARLAACPSGPPTIHQALDYVAHYARDVQALLSANEALAKALREAEQHMTKPGSGRGCVCRCPVIDGHTENCPIMAALAGAETGAEGGHE